MDGRFFFLLILGKGRIYHVSNESEKWQNEGEESMPIPGLLHVAIFLMGKTWKTEDQKKKLEVPLHSPFSPFVNKSADFF